MNFLVLFVQIWFWLLWLSLGTTFSLKVFFSNFKLDSVTLNSPPIACGVYLFPGPPESMKLKCMCLHETSSSLETLVLSS